MTSEFQIKTIPVLVKWLNLGKFAAGFPNGENFKNAKCLKNSRKVNTIYFCNIKTASRASTSYRSIGGYETHWVTVRIVKHCDCMQCESSTAVNSAEINSH